MEATSGATREVISESSVAGSSNDCQKPDVMAPRKVFTTGPSEAAPDLRDAASSASTAAAALHAMVPLCARSLQRAD